MFMKSSFLLAVGCDRVRENSGHAKAAISVAWTFMSETFASKVALSSG
jgi:hypothetical protein